MPKLATALAMSIFLSTAATAAKAQATGSGAQPAADRLASGDWIADLALSRMELTDPQKNTLRPVLAEFARESAKANDALAEKLKDPEAKLEAMRDLANDNGSLADLPKNDAYKTLEADITQLQTDNYKTTVARHARIVNAVTKELTHNQKRLFTMYSGQATSDPKAFLTSRAMSAVAEWAPDIDLPDDLYEPLVTKIETLIAQQDDDVKKSGESDPAQLAQWSLDLRKRLKAVVEAVLTEPQKTQAAATRKQRYAKLVDLAANTVLKSIEHLNPTPDQTAKAAALAATAREKMLHLDPDFSPGMYDIYTQLRKDINDLLSEDQRQTAQKPVQVKTN